MTRQYSGLGTNGSRLRSTYSHIGDNSMNVEPYESHLNIGNTVFPGFNDKKGIMLCGYEWGYSARDKYLETYHQDDIDKKRAQANTFFKKSQIFGSPYDRNIIKWFHFFGHPLGDDDGFSSFDKCLVQTNWCDTQDTKFSGYAKLLSDANVENFLNIVEHFRPKVLFFFGVMQIRALQSASLKSRFCDIFGKEVTPLSFYQKPFTGRRFNIGFQRFDSVDIVAMPHPSGTRGLSDAYIRLFGDEIGQILASYRMGKGV